MKKKLIIVLIMITSLLMVSGCNKKENYITDNEQLYDEVVKYMIDNDNNPEKSKDRYKLFIDYTGFGITEDDNNKYVYIWISDEAYYVEDNKIISGSGSSIPYKFTLKDNKVIKYETPKDGSEYISSIKKMYPDDIEDEVINYKYKDNKLIKEVREYYSDLEDKNIYYYNGEEYIKLDK